MLNEYNETAKKIADSFDKNITIIKRKSNDEKEFDDINMPIKKLDSKEVETNIDNIETSQNNENDKNNSGKKIICKHAKYSK